jgi:hypothetical protein
MTEHVMDPCAAPKLVVELSPGLSRIGKSEGGADSALVFSAWERYF